jgi:hypothetical protein
MVRILATKLLTIQSVSALSVARVGPVARGVSDRRYAADHAREYDNAEQSEPSSRRGETDPPLP